MLFARENTHLISELDFYNLSHFGMKGHGLVLMQQLNNEEIKVSSSISSSYQLSYCRVCTKRNTEHFSVPVFTE